jgi:uncharacterized protein YodC (DUF2158 family)
MSIEAGDVVVLKAGGPKMTAEYIEDEHVKCVWFVAENLYRDKFKATSLDKIGE